jgi:hypothetical protein
LPRGRTSRAGADGGRGNHAASLVARDCLPKLRSPEEHAWRNSGLELTSDRVLIQRIDDDSMLTDAGKGIKGIVLAVGPGKWQDGYRRPMDVKPGMKVLFNSKWNDLAHGELRGTGADGSGPLERPISYKLDANLHLVTEGDIFAIVDHFDFRASLGQTMLQQDFARNFTTIES